MARGPKTAQDDALCLLGSWIDLDSESIRFALRLAKSHGYRHSQHPATGRKLEIPEGELYTVQARIVERLMQTLAVASAAHGGVPGRSILSHARCHLPEARHLLSMDIAKAYRSIRRPAIRRALRGLVRPLARDICLDQKERRALVELLLLLCARPKGLPTGAPTSAPLFNLAAVALDKTLERLVQQECGHQARYSRYLDDLVFSSPTSLPAELPSLVARAITVHDLGRLNRSKTRLATSPGDELEVTGVIHDGLGFALSEGRLRALQLRVSGLDPKAEADRRSARGLRRFVQLVYGRDRAPIALINSLRSLEAGR